ncbi:cupredoxin domain-containing protein [Paenibacillus profundus]|uniref:Cupredoxin domain-containing protein n=1 Tax=Paenibacillus profundus TaxID=1173085 RepID=A0ABS8YLM2_9BACL|nr:cupredoxin domain-containing protein [Paenibacillus profundus]MCE5171353.1 cupredoxin domain-containing protein [Paenibacillus profundus]
MQKWTMFILFSVACLFAAGLMLFNMPQPEAEEAAPEGVQLVKIVATNDFKFDQAEYKVKAGEKVRLKLVNKSGFHGAGIKDFDIDLKDGQMEKDVVFDKPGKYEIHCSVMCGTGHDDMKSFLVVE